MKIAHETVIVDRTPFPVGDETEAILAELRSSIRSVCWPPGSTAFTIRPERMGNGVKPIKEACMLELRESYGWELEAKFPASTADQFMRGPGKLDASRKFSQGLFVLEWETGNISSTHRAINKIALGMLRETLFGGLLVLPTRRLARYLTDRIGNFEEIEPYFPLWQALPLKAGQLMVIAIEHDAVDEHVARIAKGTDGRALR